MDKSFWREISQFIKTLYKSLPLQINTFICKNLLKGDRELAHRSRGWAALPEKENSISWSTQWFTTIWNSSSRQSKVILRPQRTPGSQVVRRHICRQSNVHIKCISEEPKKLSAVYATPSHESTQHSTGSCNHQNTRKGNSQDGQTSWTLAICSQSKCNDI